MSGPKMPDRPTLDDPFDLVGDVIDGQFRVDAVAGEGGLSVVYRGWHQSVDATVAIKCLNLPATLDPSLVEPFVQSFREGTKIQYRLSRGNLNIAQSLASGSTLAPRTGNLVPYLVREWLEGQSLASYLAERRAKKLGGLKLDAVIALLEGAADGLGFAHAQGIAHHAVNPSNLFVVETSGRLSVKILDFGLAKAASDPAVQMPGLRVLLPEYAAPEQIDRQLGEPGPWTDVYSLALIVMEALLGAPVLVSKEGAPAAQIDPVLRPSARIAGLGLSLAVRDLLERAVALEPQKRPSTAGEFWGALKSATVRATTVGATGAARGLAKAMGPLTQKPETIPRLPRSSSRKTMVGLGEELAPLPDEPPQAETPQPPPLPVTPTLRFPFVPGPSPAPSLSLNPLSPVPTPAPPLLGAHALAPPPSFAPALSLTPTLAPAVPPPLPPALAPDLSPQLPSAPTEPASSTPVISSPSRTTSLLPAGLRKLRSLIVLSVAISSVALVVLAMLTVYVVGVARRVGRTPQSVASVSAAPTPAAPPPAPLASAATAARPAVTSPLTTFDSGAPPPPTKRLVGAAAFAALGAIGEHLESCERPGGRSGPGAAWVTFGRNGFVTHIKVGPPFAGTPEGKCLTDLFRSARVGPFLGPPGAVIYKFNLPSP